MRILGEDVPFRENLVFTFRRYRVWWAILVVTLVFDYISTLGFLAEHGLAAEANGLIRFLMVNLGAYTGLALAKGLQLLSVMVFAGLHRRLGNLFLLIVVILNCWAVVINSIH